jgi:hypothetical protein
MVAAADAARELNEGVNEKRIRSHFRYYDTETAGRNSVFR